VSTWVLLRGLTREQAHWGRFVGQFQQALPGERIVTLDLPGAGVLHGQPSPLRVPEIAQACRQQLQQLGLSPPYWLLGLSLGGMVAACWALARPLEVSGCVLVNTSMRPLSPAHRRLRPVHWPTLLRLAVARDAVAVETAVLAMTSRLTAGPAERARQVADWAAIRRARPVSAANALRQLVAAARYRLPAAPPPVPALVLCSERDGLVDPRCSRALASHWRCEIAVHPAAGHDLPLDDGPWLAATVRDWVRELEPAPGPPAGP
jgi:pimeloyl-ACP methyl ester carboxylesterase